MLTHAQIAELIRIVKQHADHFLVSMLGYKVVDDKDLKELINAGIIPPTTDPKIFQYAYILGKLKAILTAKQYKALSFKDMKEVVREKWAIAQPTSELEESRIRAAERRAARGLQNIRRNIVDGLYKKIEEEQSKTITEAEVKDIVKDQVVTALKTRASITSLASAIPRELKSYSRDWLMVASTEMHSARQHGTADAIIRGTGAYSGFSEDADDRRVFVQPTRGACDECKDAYLDERGIPKIFKLSELMANGTNIGVPKKQRKPVVPPHHPWCLCEMNYIPPGHEFNDDGELYLKDPSALLKAEAA